jgi:prepilin-type N-terminal cleavage/methylation domain-containing protein
MDMKKKEGFTLIELMIVIAIIAIIAAIAIPGLLQSQRASNERSASASLKTATTGEADFRANDRDGNRVADFWTFNVAGLYSMTNGVIAGNSAAGDDPIRLIELSVAGAEASTLTAAAGEYSAINTYCVQSAKAGYWFQALRSDLSGTAETYLQNTSGTNSAGTAMPGVGTGNAAYHTGKFGFLSWPDTLSSGKVAFIVNENNTIYRRALTATLRVGTANPPGLATDAGFIDWPTDANIKTFWGKLD